MQFRPPILFNSTQIRRQCLHLSRLPGSRRRNTNCNCHELQVSVSFSPDFCALQLVVSCFTHILTPAQFQSNFSTKIEYLLDGSEPKLLEFECQREGECPAAYTPLCVLSGYVGVIKDDYMVGLDVATVLLLGERNKVTLRVR
jgi:hypothetical protein